MRGLLFVAPGRIEFRDDLPEPRVREPTDAIVGVRLAAICGSDLHPYEGREPAAVGVVPGHEAAGEVLAVGPAVRAFRPGDRVFLPFSTSCGRCGPCRAGLSARCHAGQLFGWAPPGSPERGLHGTQAERLRVPLADTTLVALPDDLDWRAGVLLADNFTTGWHAARSAGVDAGAGRPVAVLGCGVVGLSALVAARRAGAGPILAVDPVGSRREKARRLGADAVAPPEGASAALEDAAGGPGGDGAGLVIEAVGSEAARRLAVTLAGPGATVSSVGVPTSAFGFDPSRLYDLNLTWRSGRCPVRSVVQELLRAVAGGLALPVDELLPGPVLPLEEGPAAYARFASREAPADKPLLDPRTAASPGAGRPPGKPENIA